MEDRAWHAEPSSPPASAKNRGFNLSNPYVELTEMGARCPHSGQYTDAAETDL